MTYIGLKRTVFKLESLFLAGGKFHRVMLGLAGLMLFGLFAYHAARASLVIDGVRWFWLDDDQMISMRYARHLASGDGPVWNVGERVEGYTNPLWVVLMALLHFLPVSDLKLSLLVQALNLGLCWGVVLQALVLLKQLAPQRGRFAQLFVVLSICLCWDIIFWSTNGFETTLLTFLHLVFINALFDKRPSAVAYVSLALIPLVRGDGLHIWCENALLALIYSSDRKASLRALLFAALPTFAHFGFRRFYYGQWLPNTYYLKSVGLPDKHMRGFFYVRNFALRYAVPLCLAAACALGRLGLGDLRAASWRAAWKKPGPGWILLVSVLGSAAYCWMVGGDNFDGFRFFAHSLPLLFVFAVAGAEQFVPALLGRLAWMLALLFTVMPLLNPHEVLTRPGHNGDPYQQVVVSALLRKNALPESSIAVIPAGIVPYFSKLFAYDILGKTDATIARLPYRPRTQLAHGKWDAEHTLGFAPDFVISCRSEAYGRSASTRLRQDGHRGDYVLEFLASKPFREKYLRYPIAESFLAQFTQIYTHEDSKEVQRRKWRGVRQGAPAQH